MHIYQRTLSGFNLFYTIDDFLVYYTIAAVQADAHGVCLMGLCLMIDHIHMLLTAGSLRKMSGFVSSCSSLFVREFNAHTGRTGRLFEPSYGSAVKLGMKKIRSAIAYLFNNPVEKKLCRRAEEYRWSFLPYYRHRNLFSIPVKSCSRRLRKAMDLVEDSFRNGRYLKYALLRIIFKDLDNEEKMFIIDHIISIYFPFEKDMLTCCYGSYEDMLVAINSNTGSEYEISERHYGKTDVPYREIISCVKNLGYHNVRSVILLPKETKKQLMVILKKTTSASHVQIMKFLHLKP